MGRTRSAHFDRATRAGQPCGAWAEPITSPYLERLEKGQPVFEPDGNWPWQEPFFPKVEDVRAAIAETEQKEAAA